MKRNLLVALFVLVVVGVLAWVFSPEAIEVETATAVKGRFQRTIDEDARTRLLDRYVVAAPIAGNVERISLKEGDVVEVGETVAVILPAVPTMLDARTEQQQKARVATAEAAVDRARARIERNKVAVDQAKGDLSRSEQLATQGFVSTTKLESDRLALKATEKDGETAQQDLHVATHDLDEARAALKQYQSPSVATRGKCWSVKAPIRGRVLRVVQTSEGTVNVGAALLEIGDLSRIEVVAEMLTADALQLAAGTLVLMERWGGIGTLDGRVRAVDPAAFTKVSALGVEEQRVLVHIDITTPREKWQALGDGFRLSARAVVQDVPEVVKVPVSAVFPVAGKMAVFVAEGDRVRLSNLEVGARNGIEAWIKSGLNEGAKVVVYPPTRLTDGARIRDRSR